MPPSKIFQQIRSAVLFISTGTKKGCVLLVSVIRIILYLFNVLCVGIPTIHGLLESPNSWIFINSYWRKMISGLRQLIIKKS